MNEECHLDAAPAPGRENNAAPFPMAYAQCRLALSRRAAGTGPPEPEPAAGTCRRNLPPEPAAGTCRRNLPPEPASGTSRWNPAAGTGPPGRRNRADGPPEQQSRSPRMCIKNGKFINELKL
jgi:hypothetical protein